MKEIEERYDVQFVTVPEVGYSAAILKPKNPGDDAVLAVAGTDSATDLLVDVGQLIPSTGTGEALGGVAEGLAARNPAAIAGAAGQYALGTLARAQYDGTLVLADALVKRYGRDKVTVVGHSLGGGQATYAGAMLAVRAVGFNAAPLGPTNLENIRRFGVPGAEANITQINAAGELVSSYSPGQQLGEVVTVEGRESGFFAFFFNHYLDNVDDSQPLDYRPAPGVRR
jgi:hypothetical protein